MAVYGIGLKVNTLPVVALGIGIGVDYGIYMYNRLDDLLRQGHSLREAFYRTLRLTGRAVIFTGFTLAAGVGTWMFSDLQFQVDMGLPAGLHFPGQHGGRHHPAAGAGSFAGVSKGTRRRKEKLMTVELEAQANAAE